MHICVFLNIRFQFTKQHFFQSTCTHTSRNPHPCATMALPQRDWLFGLSEDGTHGARLSFLKGSGNQGARMAARQVEVMSLLMSCVRVVRCWWWWLIAPTLSSCSSSETLLQTVAPAHGNSTRKRDARRERATSSGEDPKNVLLDPSQYTENNFEAVYYYDQG